MTTKFLTGILLSVAAASEVPTADSLFQTGKFAEAEKAYSAANPKDSRAELRLGQIALYSNRFEDAEKHLRKALALEPDEATAKTANSLLAESFYRRDNYPEAAKWFRAAGNDAKATALDNFKADKPYQVEANAETTSLKFVVADPLPVVQVKVNGGDSVYFLIDTGGPEVVLATDFASKLGLESIKGGQGTLAQGKKATIEYSRIASLTLGDFLIRNLPANLLPLPEISGYKISGILGTELLYHFLPTLDYPAGRLILRKKSKKLDRQFTRGIVIPFWLAGDHYMVAWGRVNQAPELLLVDTGFAGGGFLCPQSTLKQAGIAVQPQEGQPLSPFVVDDLVLADAHQQKIHGLTGVFPPSLENQFGFRIGGLISHEFFKPYVVTFDFERMRIILENHQ